LVIPFTPLLEIPPFFGAFTFTVLYRIHFTTFFLFIYSNSNGAVLQSKIAFISPSLRPGGSERGGKAEIKARSGALCGEPARPGLEAMPVS
jgi:hypothetical protein